MELKLLRSFVFVADTNSFSIAAKRCHLTQSAISQHIKALEDKLNCQLVIRSPHKVTLTDIGEALLPRAKEIVKLTDESVDYINALNNCYTGELRLGVGSFITPYIRKAAFAFMERYPGVLPNVVFTKACHLNKMLREHSIDLAFTMNIAQDEECIKTQPCIPFNVCAIMRNTHPLASLPKVTYDDIMKYSVVMPDIGERVFDTFQRYIKKDLSKLKVKCIVSNPDEAIAVVEEVNCITFLPKLYLENHPNLVALPIEGIEQQLMSNAHWCTDVPLKKSAQLFLDIVKGEAVPYFTTIQENI